MKKRLCYNSTVPQWVEDSVNAEYWKGEKYMKYCPYCGADLPDSAASFCTECGKRLSPAKAAPEKEKAKDAVGRKGVGKKRDALPAKLQKHSDYGDETPPSSKADGYDGYYDDVLPSDAGKLGDEIDTGLIKKVTAVIGAMLLIIVLCVVAMYLL